MIVVHLQAQDSSKNIVVNEVPHSYASTFKEHYQEHIGKRGNPDITWKMFLASFHAYLDVEVDCIKQKFIGLCNQQRTGDAWMFLFKFFRLPQ